MSIKLPSVKTTVNAVFKPSKILAAVDRAEIRVLKIQGYELHKVAKSLLVSGGSKNKTSKPGSPPKGHLGLLKKHLRYEVDTAKRFVDIGPERLAKPGLAPATLEHGGTAALAIRKRVGGKMVATGKTRRVRIEARPFMGPALIRSTPTLATIWKDSIRGVK